MKKIIWCIVILLAFTCCMPQISFYTSLCNIQNTEATEDDGSMQTAENIAINYARKNKKVSIKKYTETARKIIVNRSAVYCDRDFNDLGLLSEAIKRDYSGEDPDNINII